VIGERGRKSGTWGWSAVNPFGAVNVRQRSLQFVQLRLAPLKGRSNFFRQVVPNSIAIIVREIIVREIIVHARHPDRPLAPPAPRCTTRPACATAPTVQRGHDCRRGMLASPAKSPGRPPVRLPVPAISRPRRSIRHMGKSLCATARGEKPRTTGYPKCYPTR
jgi:hypothetical protein